jgi:hypothetical protein
VDEEDVRIGSFSAIHAAHSSRMAWNWDIWPAIKRTWLPGAVPIATTQSGGHHLWLTCTVALTSPRLVLWICIGRTRWF